MNPIGFLGPQAPIIGTSRESKMFYGKSSEEIKEILSKNGTMISAKEKLDPEKYTVISHDEFMDRLSKGIRPDKYTVVNITGFEDKLLEKLDPDTDYAIYDPNNLSMRIGDSHMGIHKLGCRCEFGLGMTCVTQGDQEIANIEHAFNLQQHTISDMISKEQDRLEQFQGLSEEKSYYQKLLDNVGYQHKGNCKHWGVTITEDRYGYRKGSFVTEEELKKAFESVSEKIDRLVSPERSKSDILSIPRGSFNYNSAALVEATGFEGDCFEQITKDSIMFSYDSLTEENFVEWTNAKIDMLTEKAEGFKRAAEKYDEMVRKEAESERFLIWGMNAQTLYKTLSGKSDDDIRLPDGSMPERLNAMFFPTYNVMSEAEKSRYIDTTSVNAMFMNTSEVKSMIAKKADSAAIAEHLGNIYKRIEGAYSSHVFGKKSYYQICFGMEEYTANLIKACGRTKDMDMISDMINDIRYGK